MVNKLSLSVDSMINMRGFGALQGVWANAVYEDASTPCSTNASIQQEAAIPVLRHRQGEL